MVDCTTTEFSVNGKDVMKTVFNSANITEGKILKDVNRHINLYKDTVAFWKKSSNDVTVIKYIGNFVKDVCYVIYKENKIIYYYL